MPRRRRRKRPAEGSWFSKFLAGGATQLATLFVGILVGVSVPVILGWIQGPAERAADVVDIPTGEVVSLREVGFPSGFEGLTDEQLDRPGRYLRIAYTAKGYESETLQFSIHVYDAATQSRVLGLYDGYEESGIDSSWEVEMDTEQKSGRVRGWVPLPTMPGNYYFAVAVFHGDDELDFEESDPFEVS